jgi:hypothetical protein
MYFNLPISSSISAIDNAGFINRSGLYRSMTDINLVSDTVLEVQQDLLEQCLLSPSSYKSGYVQYRSGDLYVSLMTPSAAFQDVQEGKDAYLDVKTKQS